MTPRQTLEHFQTCRRDHNHSFVVDTPDGKALLNYSWLESAYMVRDGDNLKIKFYFSDAVEQTSEPIE